MKIASNKIKDIIRFFKEQLKDIYDESEVNAMIRYCFEEFSGIRNVNANERGDDTVSESELLKYNFAVKDLKKEKPLQYILGKADFYGLKFIVNENVLIPRPETEELVHLIIKDVKSYGLTSQISILDIGTGSGCIPVTLKKYIPKADIFAIDISEKALETAHLNATVNSVEVNFIPFNILSESELPVPDLDIIVSNPPYIKLSEKETMKKNVLVYEPHVALFVNDEDSLLFYRAIANHAVKKLKPGGKIYFEINEKLGFETKELMEQKGFKNVELIKDINNKNRILRGTLGV
jgi:release factor glutamine methyltransferase